LGGNTTGNPVHGIIMAPDMKFNADYNRLYGRSFGGDSADFKLVSGFWIYQPTTLEQPDGPVPEPLTIFGMALGVGSVGAYVVRRGRA